MTEINNRKLREALGIEIDQDISCKSLGLVSDLTKRDMLSFLDDERFIEDLDGNAGVAAVFVSKALSSKIRSPAVKKIVCEDPRHSYYSLFNFLARENYQQWDTRIHQTANIDPNVSIPEYNVQIGENVTIEPNVVIFPDVSIGDNCVVRAGSILGSEGYEHKRTSSGILSVFHDGQVIIGNHVVIGASNIIDKGFSDRATQIDDDTKCNSFVFVGHCAQIGKRCLVGIGAIATGNSTIEDDVWIGPRATISNHVRIGQGARVTMGSVVTRSVEPGGHVTGNFAVDHDKFLQFVKSIR